MFFFPPCSLCVVNSTAIPFLFWATLQNQHLSYAQSHLSQATQCWFLWRTTCKHVMHRLCTHKPSLCIANHLRKWHKCNITNAKLSTLYYGIPWRNFLSFGTHFDIDLRWIYSKICHHFTLMSDRLKWWQSPISLRTLSWWHPSWHVILWAWTDS